MAKQVLFIHGGGEDGYRSDTQLADLLALELGADYTVIYPQMPSDSNLGDFGWIDKIEAELEKLDEQVILMGHSLGASMLLKCLSEGRPAKSISAVFLLAPPFWDGNEDWKQGLKLKPDFSLKLPKNLPIYFYHCRDDKEVHFSDLDKYRQHMPNADFTELENGGHQFTGNLALLAGDIKRRA